MTFEPDTHETPVLFRIERRKGGEVSAVFPCEPYDMTGTGMTCYAHIGQHGGCSFGWYHSSTHRAATPAEYASLKAELESEPYGYRLKVYKRLHTGLRDQYKAELKRMRSQR